MDNSYAALKVSTVDVFQKENCTVNEGVQVGTAVSRKWFRCGKKKRKEKKCKILYMCLIDFIGCIYVNRPFKHEAAGIHPY